MKAQRSLVIFFALLSLPAARLHGQTTASSTSGSPKPVASVAGNVTTSSGFASPVATSTASSIPELKARADSGDPVARHELAIFLISSDPSVLGFDQALSWLESLASKNVPDAQFLLGYFYEHAKGLPRDLAKALEN